MVSLVARVLRVAGRAGSAGVVAGFCSSYAGRPKLMIR